MADSHVTEYKLIGTKKLFVTEIFTKLGAIAIEIDKYTCVSITEKKTTPSVSINRNLSLF